MSSEVQVTELMFSDHKPLTTTLFCSTVEIKYISIGPM